MAYSIVFRERMIEKMLGPDGITARELAEEAGVATVTLRRWRKEATLGAKVGQKSSGKRPRRRGAYMPKEKIRIVMEAAALPEDELGAFLRREGLHSADLERLREEVMQAAEKGFESSKKQGPSPAEEELKKVQKELVRKEKALAEAAAILVLRGKLDAFLSEEEEGDTNGKKDE